MKFIASVLFLSCIALVQCNKDDLEKYKEWQRECVVETQVENDVVERMKQGIFSDDPKLKTFMVCFYKKASWMNDAGEFQPDEFKRQIARKFNETDTEKILKACGGIKKSTPEETAFEISKCFHENKP